MVFILTGCGAMFGFKNIQNLDENSYLEFAEFFQIEEFPNYRIDLNKFKSTLNGISDSVLKKYVSQPLQIRVFNTDGKIIFSLVNCNVSGFPNLQWNRFGTFDLYPPQLEHYRNVDSVFMLNTDTTNLISVNGKDFPADGDLTLVVYFTYAFNKQSKDLIELAKQYSVKFEEHNIQLVFVNMDEYFFLQD